MASAECRRWFRIDVFLTGAGQDEIMSLNSTNIHSNCQSAELDSALKHGLD